MTEGIVNRSLLGINVRNAAIKWWQARHAREQKVLIYGLMSVLLILALGLAMNFWQYRQQLQRKLPNLRNQAMMSDYFAQVLEGRVLESSESVSMRVNKILARYASGKTFVLAEKQANETITINIQDAKNVDGLRFIEQLEKEAQATILSATFSENGEALASPSLAIKPSTKPPMARGIWSGTVVISKKTD